jgi:hypothetical protein
MAENFRTQILNSKETSSIQTPVRTLGSCTFMYLRHSDLYILMVTKNNANVMMALKFMTSVSKGNWILAGTAGVPEAWHEQQPAAAALQLGLDCAPHVHSWLPFAAGDGMLLTMTAQHVIQLLQHTLLCMMLV